jgi:S-adenosylmethionine synthetase
VELAYAIGVADPVSVMVDTFGTGNYDDETLEACIREVFPLKPAGIIRHLDLLRPIYRQTAKNGHFGRELPDFRWEAVDKGDDIRRFLAR